MADKDKTTKDQNSNQVAIDDKNFPQGVNTGSTIPQTTKEDNTYSREWQSEQRKHEEGLDEEALEEMGPLGDSPATGSDQAEQPVDVTAAEMGIHSEGDHVNGPKPLRLGEDLTDNEREEDDNPNRHIADKNDNNDEES